MEVCDCPVDWQEGNLRDNPTPPPDNNAGGNGDPPTVATGANAGGKDGKDGKDGSEFAYPDTQIELGFSTASQSQINIATLFQNGAKHRDLRCVLHPSLPRVLGAKHVLNPGLKRLTPLYLSYNISLLF